MTASRLRVVLSAVALGIAAVEVLYLAIGIDGASDSAAVGVTLLADIALPVCLAGAIATLLRGRLARIGLVGAAAAAGLAASALTAAIIAADDPADPAWIHALAAAGPAALVVAGLLAALAWSRLLRGRAVPRLFGAPALGVPSAVVGAYLLETIQVSVLGAIALPIVLAVRHRRIRHVTAAG